MCNTLRNPLKVDMFKNSNIGALKIKHSSTVKRSNEPDKERIKTNCFN